MASVIVDAIEDTNRRKKLVAESAYISTLQRRHFIVFDVVPPLIALTAIPYHMFIPIRLSDVAAFLLLWAITGLGVTVGYHRLFTHRAFSAPAGVRTALAFCGALAGQGPVISWAAIHRRHHELSDRHGDPHSPNLHGETTRGIIAGLLHSHYTWMCKHDYPNAAHYTKDLLKDRTIQSINRNYYAIALAGLLAPGLLCGVLTADWTAVASGALWGGFIRMTVLGNTIWAINSFLHRFGSRPFATDDNSHNAGLFSLLTFGEAWHNNHHAFPTSAKFGLRRGWTDPGWWLVVALGRLGLASAVRQPTDAMIDQQLAQGARR